MELTINDLGAMIRIGQQVAGRALDLSERQSNELNANPSAPARHSLRISRKRENMSKSGHHVLALAMAATVLANDLNSSGLATAVGVVFGASGPDWLEIVRWSPYGERMSAIPHRTLTHYWPAWMFVAIVSMALPWPLNLLVFGFSASCLLHILVDLGSPMGCPLVTPWRRWRSPVIFYRTGEASELPFVLVAVAIIAFDFMWRGSSVLYALSHWRFV